MANPLTGVVTEKLQAVIHSGDGDFLFSDEAGLAPAGGTDATEPLRTERYFPRNRYSELTAAVMGEGILLCFHDVSHTYEAFSETKPAKSVASALGVTAETHFRILRNRLRAATPVPSTSAEGLGD